MKLFLGGVPGCGKTTVCTGLIGSLMLEGYKQKQFKMGLLRGIILQKDSQVIWIPGVFDGSLFQGTDKLSMAVQPHVEQFFETALAGGSVFIEGDRLFKPSFLKKMDLIYIIDNNEAVNESRRELRGSKQAAQWLKSKATGVENVKREFPHKLVSTLNKEQTDNLIQDIKGKLCESILRPALSQ